MTREPRLRVGVIGAGLIAQVMHLHHLRELSDRFEVTAICDLSPAVREWVADTYGISRRFARWEDLLAEPLDAVLVLTSGSHAPATIAAASAGLHVFVEKPMCLLVEEGVAMVEAARRAGVRLVVGYNKRFDPAYERLRDELGQFHDLRLARVTTLESPFQPYVAHYPLVKGADVPAEVLAELRSQDEERVTRAIGEVDPLTRQTYRWVLLDSLVHELNALRGLLGEPERLDFAEIRERAVTVILTFRRVQCNLTWIDLQDGIARYRMEFAFYAPDRRATLAFPSPFLRNAPTRLVFEGGEVGTARSWETVETVSYEESFKRELESLYDCVVRGAEPRTPGIDGLRDVALCQAIVASHVGRAPINGPTDLGKWGLPS
jgi:predicted dehydrogenase